MTSHHSLKVLTLGLASFFSISAFASGFQLFEYNGEDIGNSGAGAAAIAEDASTNFPNPAGMTRLPHPQITLSADPIDAHADFQGQACGGLVGVTPVPRSGTLPTGATISNACNVKRVHNDGGTFAIVPAIAASVPITDRWFAGLDVTAPFGLKTDYGLDTPVQYTATHSEVFTLNINPNVAFKFNNHWSFAAGFNALYINAILNQSINFFPNGAGLTPNGAPFTLPIAPTQDSYVKNEADDWGFGWNAGILYQYDDNTRAGLSYRSHIVVNPTGRSRLSGDSITTAIQTDHAHTTLDLPATTILSGYHLFNPQWAAMASVFYTQWSSIQKIVLRNTAIPQTLTLLPSAPPLTALVVPTFGTVTLPQGYRNTWRASAGADYMPTSSWRVRAGVEFDETPVRTKHRTVRLPDGNRWVGSVGAGYTMNENMRFDVGYAHLFIADGKINDVGSIFETIGTSKNNANVFGFQGTFTLT